MYVLTAGTSSAIRGTGSNKLAFDAGLWSMRQQTGGTLTPAGAWTVEWVWVGHRQTHGRADPNRSVSFSERVRVPPVPAPRRRNV